MGMREEGLPTRLVHGFSGKIRPMQVVGGPCNICNEEVWIDIPPKTGKDYLGTEVRHWGCEKTGERKSDSNVIPVPGYEK